MQSFLVKTGAPYIQQYGLMPLASIGAILHSLHVCKKEKGRTHTVRLYAYIITLGLGAHASVVHQLLAGEVCTHNALQFVKQPTEGLLNSLIANYAECGEPDRVCYQDMLKDGSIHAYGRTLVASLSSCAKIKDLATGMNVHAEVSRLGLLEMDIIVGTATVDMYFKCGSLGKGHETFNRLPTRNIVTWNSLVADYAGHDRSEEALHCYEQLQIEGLSPNSVTYVCCLKACGNMQAIGKCQGLHAELEGKGYLEENPFVGSALIDVYVKCDLLHDARKVFAKLRVHDVVSWTALIAGYADHEWDEEALECLEQMKLEGFSPNAVTFVCGLKACCNIAATAKALGIHSEIERRGLLERNIHVGSALVDMYAKGGSIQKALEVFGRLPNHDVVSWTALITGYADYGFEQEALECFETMLLEGIPADANAFVAGLKACGGIRSLDKGTRMHCEIERRGLCDYDGVIGSSLVDMYAKCGSLPEAEEVFECLPFKKVASWNALLAGYGEHGCGEEALGCFRQMVLEGVSLDCVTFVCALKACGTMLDIAMGMEIYSEVERLGLMGEDSAIGSTLINMYLKCGEPNKAWQVFDALPSKDTVLWNALIAGYIEQELSDEALECFELMQYQGDSPDDVTFICVLKACSHSRALYKGQEIHSEIWRIGLMERNPSIGTALFDMYLSCGMLVDAQQMFEKLPFRDPVSWNALIAGYAEHAHGEEALNHFEHMQIEGVFPDIATFISSFKASRSVRTTCKGLELHNEVERKRLARTDIAVGNSLIGMYGEYDSLARVQQLFDELPARSIVSWNGLIYAYAKHGHGEEILELLEVMREEDLLPVAHTYVSGLKACGYLGALEKGYEIHAEIEKRGLCENLFVSSGLVDMYAKCSVLVTAQCIFDKLPIRDVVVWNVLLAGYTELDWGEEAFMVMERMQKEEVSSNAATHVLCLKTFGCFGAIAKGRGFHAEIERLGLWKSDLAVGNALVDMYSRCGSLAVARELLDELPMRDIVSWNSLISGYIQLGETERALDSFDQLVKGGGGTRPDMVTYLLMLNACSRACLVDRSSLYFGAMSEVHGILPMVEHHACVIDLLGRTGQLEKAVEMMKDVPLCDNIVALHTILSACKAWGNLHIARVAFGHAMGPDAKDSSNI